MSVQELAAYLLGAVAAAYLLVRYLRRRASANCCGEKECPASREMVENLQRKLK